MKCDDNECINILAIKKLNDKYLLASALIKIYMACIMRESNLLVLYMMHIMY